MIVNFKVEDIFFLQLYESIIIDTKSFILFRFEQLYVHILCHYEHLNIQILLKREYLIAHSLGFLKTNGNEFILADMTGFSRNDVNVYSSLLEIPINILGYGYVINQSIPPDEVVNKETIIEVNMQ